MSENEVAGDSERSSLVKEIQDAFKLGRRRGRARGRGSRTRRREAPELAWLGGQCAEGGLYPLYSGDRSKLSILEKQTCKRWKSMMEMELVKHPLRQRRRVVLIQPITHRHGNTVLRKPRSPGKEEEEGYRHTHISNTVLGLLQEFCSAYFSEMEVKLVPSVDLSEIPRLTSRIHKSTNRRQFLVDDIIHYLSTKKLHKAYCVLGVTIVDLYPGPKWNFVLGQACMEKGSGVFSFGRWFNSTPTVTDTATDTATATSATATTATATTAIAASTTATVATTDTDIAATTDTATTGATATVAGVASEDGEDEWEQEQIRNLWVLMRVMSHELCHLFGLAHCHYFQCAMNESSSIEEAATAQPLFLCPLCLRKMHQVHTLDMEQRFSRLLEVVKRLRTAVVKVTNQITTSSEHVDTDLGAGHVDSHGGGEGEGRGEGEGSSIAQTGTCGMTTPREQEIEGTITGQGTASGADQEASRGQGTAASTDQETSRGLDNKHTTSNGYLDRMDAAVLWLEEALRSIRLFKTSAVLNSPG